MNNLNPLFENLRTQPMISWIIKYSNINSEMVRIIINSKNIKQIIRLRIFLNNSRCRVRVFLKLMIIKVIY